MASGRVPKMTRCFCFTMNLLWLDSKFRPFDCLPGRAYMSLRKNCERHLIDGPLNAKSLRRHENLPRLTTKNQEVAATSDKS